MYCPACGTMNAAGNAHCVQCGAALPPASPIPPPPPVPPAPPPPPYLPAQRNVPNYLVQAILVTIFCCLPFGIVSIVYASQVNSKALAGDVPGALEASGKAKTWAWVALAVGLIGSILYFILMTAGILKGIADL